MNIPNAKVLMPTAIVVVLLAAVIVLLFIWAGQSRQFHAESNPLDGSGRQVGGAVGIEEEIDPNDYDYGYGY